MQEDIVQVGLLMIELFGGRENREKVYFTTGDWDATLLNFTTTCLEKKVASMASLLDVRPSKELNRSIPSSARRTDASRSAAISSKSGKSI